MTFDTLEFLDPPVTTCSESGITVMGGPAEDQFRKPSPNFMDQDIDMVDSEADAPWLLTFFAVDHGPVRRDIVRHVFAPSAGATL